MHTPRLETCSSWLQLPAGMTGSRLHCNQLLHISMQCLQALLQQSLPLSGKFSGDQLMWLVTCMKFSFSYCRCVSCNACYLPGRLLQTLDAPTASESQPTSAHSVQQTSSATASFILIAKLCSLCVRRWKSSEDVMTVVETISCRA